jgi:hypothetical protein
MTYSVIQCKPQDQMHPNASLTCMASICSLGTTKINRELHMATDNHMIKQENINPNQI